MSEVQRETLEFAGLKVPIYRQPQPDLFIALQPPQANPYIVAPLEAEPDTIIAFIQERIPLINELRAEMLKRFEKSRSARCHYQTGDVAYLFGRPFMLRVIPLAKTSSHTKGTRGRVKVKATTHTDVSVMSLYVMKTGDYDQARLAFLGYAKPLFTQNVVNLIRQCLDRTFPEQASPHHVQCRPMRDAWVSIDENTDTVWFSERLVAYPPDCVIYAYLVEAAKKYAPEASDEERHAILDAGVPGWQKIRELLNDPDSVFAQQ